MAGGSSAAACVFGMLRITRAFRLAPGVQQLRQRSGFGFVIRRSRQAAAALAQQVVGKHQPAPRRDRQHLVHAIGIEGSERGLGRVFAAQIEPHLALAVAHHELAPGVNRWQRDDQRGKHAGGLLGVAVADEEAALVVDQQLVQLGVHAGAGAQPGGSALGQRREHLGPVFARDPHLRGADLPGAPHVGVDQRVAATAIGCALGSGDELGGLRRQQRQGDRPDAFDLERGMGIAQLPLVQKSPGVCTVCRMPARVSLIISIGLFVGFDVQ